MLEFKIAQLFRSGPNYGDYRSSGPRSEQSDSPLEVVSSPERKRVELVSVHVEGHLEVCVGQVLLEVAPVDVRRKFVVAGEEKVQRVGFVICDRRRGRGGRVVRPERMGRHHVEAGNGIILEIRLTLSSQIIESDLEQKSKSLEFIH